MTSACNSEFDPVNALLNTTFETRAVDAFCLAWIKYERQLRKLAAHLIYQSEYFNRSNQIELRQAFLANTGMSHTSARGCFWRLTRVSINNLIGDRFQVLERSLAASYKAREKLFHGQQTGQTLNREQLVVRTQRVIEWCHLLSDSAHAHFGYDGFSGKTSLFKQNNQDLTEKVDRGLNELGWQEFVKRL